MSKVTGKSRWKWWFFQLPIYTYMLLLSLSIPLLIILSLFSPVEIDLWQTIPLLALLFVMKIKHKPARKRGKKLPHALLEVSKTALSRLISELNGNEEQDVKIWEAYLRIRTQLSGIQLKDRELKQKINEWNLLILKIFQRKILSTASLITREVIHRLDMDHIPIKPKYEPRKIHDYFISHPNQTYTAHFLKRNLIDHSVCKLIKDHKKSLSVYREWTDDMQAYVEYLKYLAKEMEHFEKYQDTSNSRFPFYPIENRKEIVRHFSTAKSHLS